MLSLQFKDVISFGIGTPSFPLPKHIKARIKKELDENPNIAKYTPFQGYTELRKAIAKELENRIPGLKIDPLKEIYVTTGAMEAVGTAIMTITDPGDEIILPSPAFSSHIQQIYLAGGKPVFAKLIEEENWRLDVKAVEAKITPKTKGIVITTPSNPTGAVFSEKDLRALGKLALEKDIIVIADDPYAFLVYDDNRYFSLTHIPELKENRISCYSFSKEFAMSGLRIGYVYADEGICN